MTPACNRGNRLGAESRDLFKFGIGRLDAGLVRRGGAIAASKTKRQVVLGCSQDDAGSQFNRALSRDARCI